MNNKRFIDWLNNQLLQHNLFGTDLAAKIGVSNVTVWRWRNGHYTPSDQNFVAICDVFGVQFSEILPLLCG